MLLPLSKRHWYTFSSYLRLLQKTQHVTFCAQVHLKASAMSLCQKQRRTVTETLDTPALKWKLGSAIPDFALNTRLCFFAKIGKGLAFSLSSVFPSNARVAPCSGRAISLCHHSCPGNPQWPWKAPYWNGAERRGGGKASVPDLNTAAQVKGRLYELPCHQSLSQARYTP